MRFWIYWLIACVIIGIVRGVIKGLLDIPHEPRFFSKRNMFEILNIVFTTIIAYFLFSAIKQGWIL